MATDDASQVIPVHVLRMAHYGMPWCVIVIFRFLDVMSVVSCSLANHSRGLFAPGNYSIFGVFTRIAPFFYCLQWGVTLPTYKPNLYLNYEPIPYDPTAYKQPLMMTTSTPPEYKCRLNAVGHLPTLSPCPELPHPKAQPGSNRPISSPPHSQLSFHQDQLPITYSS